MPKISFYLLPTASPEQRLLFACKLLEKAFRSRQACYVLMDSEKQSEMLDQMLWTFRAGSFIPHQIYDGTPPHPANAVVIGTMPAPKGWRQVLVNLSSKPPETLDAHEKILEILDDDGSTKDLGRQRYRFYQKSELDITTHKL